MGDIVLFTGMTKGPVEPERVLQGAIAADLGDVLVLGYAGDGSLYIGSSNGNIGSALLLMEEAKTYMVRLAVDEREIDE
jgi:hypothetical protein